MVLEEAMRLRPALDQAILTGLIEQCTYALGIPPLKASVTPAEAGSR